MGSTTKHAYLGEEEKGEEWTLGEKVPKKRWPEFVQEGEEDDDSEASIGKDIIIDNVIIKGEDV